MNVDYAKFQKTFDSRKISRESTLSPQHIIIKFFCCPKVDISR